VAHCVEEILDLYRQKGEQPYGRDPVRVSQLHHALQCAQLAERFGAGAAMITAAFLHDFGHLHSGADEASPGVSIDTSHATRGARWLSRWFAPAVTEPIRLHVAAKRYLCACDTHYFETLSPGSLITLKLQGGLFSPSEAKAFVAEPFAQAALLLRRWDDMAKDPEARPPDLEYFRRYAEESLSPRESEATA
jgi:phosphonate degradation associated HDIG domain protein